MTEKFCRKWVFPQEARNVRQKIDEDLALGIWTTVTVPSAGA
jgi:hypothetical protein